MDLTSDEIGGTEQREGEIAKENGPDLPPEYCRYRDEGCEYARSCLRCPFPQCLYDEPRGRQRWMKGLRNREITRLFGEGRSIRELALMFGVSQRTIQRALKESRQVCQGQPAVTR
jgi:transposase-like protein